MKTNYNNHLGLQIKLFSSNKGQAALEMAILGTLMLLAFATLLSYAQRFEEQNKLKMEVFRNALSRAYVRNSGVTSTLKRDTRSLNIFSRFSEGQSSNVAASANVMWVKGAPGDPETQGENSFSFYEINNKMLGGGDAQERGLPRRSKVVIDYTGNHNEVEVPVSIWKEDIIRKTSYSGTNTKEEFNNNNSEESYIYNFQIAELKDVIRNKPYTRYDKSETNPNKDAGSILPEYVYEEGLDEFSQAAYYDEETNRVKYSESAADANLRMLSQRGWRTYNE